MVRDQLVNAGLQRRQAALYPCALLRAEAVKRLGHEIIANPLARQGAFDAFNNRRRVTPDTVERLADLHDLGMKLLGSGAITRMGRLVKLDVEFGEDIRSPVDAAVT